MTLLAPAMKWQRQGISYPGLSDPQAQPAVLPQAPVKTEKLRKWRGQSQADVRCRSGPAALMASPMRWGLLPTPPSNRQPFHAAGRRDPELQSPDRHPLRYEQPSWLMWDTVLGPGRMWALGEM